MYEVMYYNTCEIRNGKGGPSKETADDQTYEPYGQIGGGGVCIGRKVVEVGQRCCIRLGNLQGQDLVYDRDRQ